MSLLEWTLAALMALPVSKHDRNVDPAIKAAQAHTVAVAITDAVSAQQKWPGEPRALAAAMVAVLQHESGLALHVHAGDCPRKGHPRECDSGLARGLWQQQASSTSSPAAWLFLAGLDLESTRHAAREAARALVRARWQCMDLERRGVGWVEMLFSAYAGRGCLGWFRGRDSRVSSFGRLML